VYTNLIIIKIRIGCLLQPPMDHPRPFPSEGCVGGGGGEGGLLLSGHNGQVSNLLCFQVQMHFYSIFKLNNAVFMLGVLIYNNKLTPYPSPSQSEYSYLHQLGMWWAALLGISPWNHHWVSIFNLKIKMEVAIAVKLKMHKYCLITTSTCTPLLAVRQEYHHPLPLPNN
jgi:hypothetical protein